MLSRAPWSLSSSQCCQNHKFCTLLSYNKHFSWALEPSQEAVHLQNTVIVWDDTIIGEFACVTRRNKLANLCTPSIQHSSLVPHIVPTGQPTDGIQKGHIFKFYWKSINHSQANNVKTQYLGINLTLYSTHTHKHIHTHAVELLE